MTEDGEETEAFYDVVNQLPENTEIRTGASKFVLFLNEKEVIKIPFNGSFYYKDKEDEDEAGFVFDPYYTEDYCEVEAHVYSDAVDAEVEQFFAETKFLGISKSGTPIYISERLATVFSSCDRVAIESSCSEDSLKKAHDIDSYLPSDFIAACIEHYGLEATIRFNKFIDEEGISDLHSGNFGFRADGSPALLDYSSFNS
jgi:hypothetical protein